MLASSAYETSVLVEGRGSMQLLNNLAARSADDVIGSSDGDMCIDVEGDDVCCQVPEEVFQERGCLLYTSPSPRDLSTSRMPSSA